MKNFLLTLYRRAYLIRAAEELIIRHYDTNEMKTPMHMSMGEEGIIVGVTTALPKGSLTFGTYRSHGLYLAVTGETDKFFAEMYGKATGVLKGKGGSMHILAPDSGLLGISAVVASTIPVAVGAAYANTIHKNNKITAVFFGDGAVDEGSFWESLNLARLKQLPVLFVCEDNGYAVHSPTSTRHGYKSLINIVKQFGISVFETHTTDAQEIYKLARRAISSIRKRGKPAFLHLHYYRYLEHVGIHEDFDKGYRSKKEFLKWQKIDPVTILRKKITSAGVRETEIQKLEQDIIRESQKSLNKALKAPFPEAAELTKHTFYEYP